MNALVSRTLSNRHHASQGPFLTSKRKLFSRMRGGRYDTLGSGVSLSLSLSLLSAGAGVSLLSACAGGSLLSAGAGGSPLSAGAGGSLRSTGPGMPRVYKKKGAKNKWTDEQLDEAIAKVRGNELSVRAAATTYGIPKSTLSDHVHGVSSKRYGGGSTVLTLDEEREIVIT